jgi:hypothetical protein
MEFKEDLVEAKERMNAWWDHELIDRPVISYYHPKGRGAMGGYLDALGQDWTLAKDLNTEINDALTSFEKRAGKTYYGGESIPSYFLNYGPGIMAAVFGVVPHFKSETIWFSRPTEPNDIIEVLEEVKLNQNNEWYTRLKKTTLEGSKRAKEMGYQFGITDLGGVLDILSSFLGPTKIILTMKRNPDIIDMCRQIILEKLLIVYDELYEIISSNCDGFNTWLNVWCAKSWYPVQCDFIAMLNPKWFKRFVLPDLIAQIDHMDYAIHHMDGPYQIPYLDDLLSIDNLTGIQWVPGAGRPPPGSEEWFPLYKKIQKAGKNIVMDTIPESVPHIYNVFDPKGLYVRAGFSSEIAANFYLPSYIGGQEGKLVNQSVEWAKQQGLKSVKKEDVNKFLEQNDLKIEMKELRELLKETNNCLREKLFFT